MATQRPNLATRTVILLLRSYQVVVSPLLHAIAGPGCGCRFHPTCSQYAREAFLRHGFFRGLYLALKRIVRCQPWGGSGDDPVPIPEPRHQEHRI